ncbi:beta-1,6-N-acetylglucosaminyltransferase [Cetobacterium ceti]
MENKHAYLIMAHNNFNILEYQLLLLDDEKNDMYIHIDKKVKNFDFNKYKNLVKKSKLCFINRLDLKWGDFSLIKCELELLKEAIKNKYEYYHLISGVDMPLKTANEIYNFFTNNNGNEFIHFCGNELDENIQNRFKYYHFTRWNRTNKYLETFSKGINLSLRLVQKFIQLKPKVQEKIMYGAQWFSITDELAKYILSKEKWIKENFKLTNCGDELFLQTIVYNSKFKGRLYSQEKDNYLSCMRYIDWKRGNPYIFKSEDFDDLISSKYLFARKFDMAIDKSIVIKIYKYLKIRE